MHSSDDAGRRPPCLPWASFVLFQGVRAGLTGEHVGIIGRYSCDTSWVIPNGHVSYYNEGTVRSFRSVGILNVVLHMVAKSRYVGASTSLSFLTDQLVLEAPSRGQLHGHSASVIHTQVFRPITSQLTT